MTGVQTCALPILNIQKIKKRLQELNLEINWIPEFLKEGRMKYNIETAPDWNVTRNRYWATAIPIWKSESGKIKVIGSIEELKQFAKKLPKEFYEQIKIYQKKPRKIQPLSFQIQDHF